MKKSVFICLTVVGVVLFCYAFQKQHGYQNRISKRNIMESFNPYGTLHNHNDHEVMQGNCDYSNCNRTDIHTHSKNDTQDRNHHEEWHENCDYPNCNQGTYSHQSYNGKNCHKHSDHH